MSPAQVCLTLHSLHKSLTEAAGKTDTLINLSGQPARWSSDLADVLELARKAVAKAERLLEAQQQALEKGPLAQKYGRGRQ